MTSDSSMSRLDNASELRQLLVALGLITDAELSLSHAAGPSCAVCAIAADAAIEAVLGMFAGHQSEPVAFERWDPLYKAAQEGAEAIGTPIPVRLGKQLRDVHRIRNGAVHQQAEVSQRDAERAVAAARGALALAWSPRRRVDAPASLAVAVADVIDCADVAGALREASGAIEKKRWLPAVDAASRAYSRARRRVEPPLGTSARRPSHFGDPRIGTTFFDDVAQYAEHLADDLENWLIPLSLGVSTTRYWRLSSLLGRIYIFGDGREEIHRREQTIDRAGASRAVDDVARIIFRLWEIGALVTDPETPTDRERLVLGLRRQDKPTG